MLIKDGLELLDERQCLDLLATTDIGRVGVTVSALPAIFTVNFVLAGMTVYFRTAPGTKLSAAAEGCVIAFQADHVEAETRSGWSVLALGSSQRVEDPDELALVASLPLHPYADGERVHVIRLPIEFISGRRIVHGL